MLNMLLALDLSDHSLRAADYVARLLPCLPGSRVQVLVISTGIPYSASQESLDSREEPELHGDVDHQQEIKEINTLIEDIKGRLLSAGLKSEQLGIKVKPLGRGVANDILDEAAASDCDTIVVGRRGLSKVKALLLGSVSTSLVQNAEGRSVWVVE